jgi:molybdopterin-guanine dinucleotide biosynthesis protein A
VLINANRNLERYRSLGVTVIEDRLGGYQGPLAGVASALEATRTPLLLTVPCDAPLLPHDLAWRLYQSLSRRTRLGLDRSLLSSGSVGPSVVRITVEWAF